MTDGPRSFSQKCLLYAMSIMVLIPIILQIIMIMTINQFETHILKHKTRIVVLSHNSMNTEMCEPKNIIEGSVT